MPEKKWQLYLEEQNKYHLMNESRQPHQSPLMEWEETLIREANELKPSPLPASWGKLEERLNGRARIFRLRNRWISIAVAASMVIATTIMIWPIKSYESHYLLVYDIEPTRGDYFVQWLKTANQIGQHLQVEEGIDPLTEPVTSSMDTL